MTEEITKLGVSIDMLKDMSGERRSGYLDPAYPAS